MKDENKPGITLAALLVIVSLGASCYAFGAFIYVLILNWR